MTTTLWKNPRLKSVYITRLNDIRSYYEGYLFQKKRDLWYCQDDEVIKLWQVEIAYVESILRSVKKAQKKVDLLNNV